ncbi:hypothetical protein ACVIGB_009227 [Bradyrhizobium sp. USDA 4341]
MLYVLGNEDAKAANIGRFGYFFEVADGHIKQLASSLMRLATSVADDDQRAIGEIERNCHWVFEQVRHRNDINFDIDRCFRVMIRVANGAYEVFSRGIPIELTRVESDVARAFMHSTLSYRPGSVESLRRRLSIQAVLLKQHASSDNIGTIAHDSAQLFALHYFLIDRRLLSESLSNG